MSHRPSTKAPPPPTRPVPPPKAPEGGSGAVPPATGEIVETLAAAVRGLVGVVDRQEQWIANLDRNIGEARADLETERSTIKQFRAAVRDLALEAIGGGDEVRAKWIRQHFASRNLWSDDNVS